MTEEDIIKVYECLTILKQLDYYLFLSVANFDSVRNFEPFNHYHINNIGCRSFNDLAEDVFEIINIAQMETVKFQSLDELYVYVNKLYKLKVML